MIAPPAAQRLAALSDGSAAGQTHLAAPLFEQAMSDLRERDPEQFSARVREVGYLVNVWISGGAHDGRRPRPAEALEMVLRTCEAGMRARLDGESATRGPEAHAVAANLRRDAIPARLPQL